MEIRARFILMGLFTLGVIVAGFAFVYWLHYTGGLGEQTVYRIRFEGTVAGLRPGSAVLFNGVRVGEVSEIRLAAGKPREVTAIVSVDRNTPVRADTKVGVYVQGLLGAPSIALEGGAAEARPLSGSPGEPPLLIADATAGQDVMQAAREVLRRIDHVIADNAEPFRAMMADLKTFAAALARNSDRLDSIAAGLERMVGGPEKASPTVYDLSAASEFPALAKIPNKQLSVAEPTAVLLLDTQKILIAPADGGASSFPDAQWSDSLPKLFEARIVESFENAKYGRIVRDIPGLAPSARLLVDIRKFRLLPAPVTAAEVEFGAKLVDQDGEIVAAQLFRADAPARAATAAAAAAALNEAFAKAVAELVTWTAGQM